MSTRDFAKTLERHGFTKAKIGGIICVMGVKFKTKTDNVDFIDDIDQRHYAYFRRIENFSNLVLLVLSSCPLQDLLLPLLLPP